jgi:hypothetical protein
MTSQVWAILNAVQCGERMTKPFPQIKCGFYAAPYLAWHEGERQGRNELPFMAVKKDVALVGVANYRA